MLGDTAFDIAFGGVFLAAGLLLAIAQRSAGLKTRSIGWLLNPLLYPSQLTTTGKRHRSIAIVLLGVCVLIGVAKVPYYAVP